MPALTKAIPRFLNAGRSAQNGLPGFLQRLVGGFGIKSAGNMGTINIASGQTSVTVLDAGVTATDFFIVTVQNKGANASAFAGVSSIVAGTSYVLNVTADPGTGGVTLSVIRIPSNLLFAS